MVKSTQCCFFLFQKRLSDTLEKSVFIKITRYASGHNVQLGLGIILRTDVLFHLWASLGSAEEGREYPARLSVGYLSWGEL